MDAAALVHGADGFQPTSTAGLVLLDTQNRVVYHNSCALNILTYTRAGKEPAATLLDHVVQLLLPVKSSKHGTLPPQFKSGRRRYACRWFVLAHSSGKPDQGITGILLERVVPSRLDLSSAAEHFGLTQREQQTVELLTLGLTSKEIASRMNISPNTVKAFFRLVMMKMAVNTRSGIVGKITQARPVV